MPRGSRIQDKDAVSTEPSQNDENEHGASVHLIVVQVQQLE